jgi:hypothetical protein
MADSLMARNAKHLSPLLRVALPLGILAHFLGFLIFKIASDPLPSRIEDPAFITLVSTEIDADASELVEQASLFDSAPLFVPGEWSSAAQVFSARVVPDWRNFSDFEPSIELMDEVRPAGLSLSGVTRVEQPSDLLELRFWDLFSNFGQVESELEAFEGGGAVALVTIMSGNKVYPVDYNIRLEVDLQSAELATHPVVFILNMSAPGFPIGAPLLEQSSGSDVLDAEVSEWLARPATLAQLPTGFLEIRVFL